MMITSQKITVVGAGYVGFSLAVLLSEAHDVTLLDIDHEKVDMINRRQSPIADALITERLENQALTIKASLNAKTAIEEAKVIIIATPTDYDAHDGAFDTRSIESVLRNIEIFNDQALVVIKSTVPLGYTDALSTRFPTLEILFSPEFLREGKALYDNLYPSRIVVGGNPDSAIFFASLLKDRAQKDDVDIILTNPTEAEAIKLFSNTYLAMRVTFFNELDTYAERHNLDAKAIIDGVSKDPRIGHHYNNPSFGYGGYCLPKDTKQLLANYKDIPNNLIKAIVDGNDTRKAHIAHMVVSKQPKTVGIFRLTMKMASDNFRDSSVIDVIERIKNHHIDVIVYEPGLHLDTFLDCHVEHDLSRFKAMSDIIVSNRFDPLLDDVKDKIYTRDIYHIN